MCQQVVVIEDDDGIRETLKDLLELEGYRVKTAANGLEGLRILEGTGTPCLILLDLMMPVMDGWQFLDAIHRRKRGSSAGTLPIMIVSAAADATDASRYGHSVMKKPVDLDQLLKTVHEYCGSASGT